MESGLCAPFISRWPNRIPASRVSNTIVHIVTLAAVAGAKAPNDRAFDGLERPEFFLDKRTDSSREGFIIFVGDDLRTLKWRNWKWHNAWQETKDNTVEPFSTVPKAVYFIRAPRETHQVVAYNTLRRYPFAQLVLDYQPTLK